MNAPAGGRRESMGILSALVTKAAVGEASMDQPTTLRGVGVEHDRAVELAFAGVVLSVGVGPRRPAGLFGWWVSAAPPSEPDVRLPPHPALHPFMPLG